MMDINEVFVAFEERNKEYKELYQKVKDKCAQLDCDALTPKQKQELLIKANHCFTKLVVLVQDEKLIIAEAKAILPKYPTLKTAFLQRELLVKSWCESLDVVSKQFKDMSWMVYSYANSMN